MKTLTASQRTLADAKQRRAIRRLAYQFPMDASSRLMHMLMTRRKRR